MTVTYIQPKLFSRLLPCMNFVRNNVIEEHFGKHIRSLHSHTLSEFSLLRLPFQLPLLNGRKTFCSDHHSCLLRQEQLFTRYRFQPFHNPNHHTSISGNHLLSSSSASSLLTSSSLPRSSTCSIRSFHLSCHHQNDWETKTTSSTWVQTSTKSLHQPTRDVAFTEKILETLCPPSGSVILDLTFGSGGHTEGILKRNPDVKVIAVDRDPLTKIRAEELRALYPNRLCFLNIKFSEVPDALDSMGVYRSSLWGAVLDSGPSYEQLTQPKRGGFCATATEKLDLRMDGTSSKSISGLDVVQNIDYDSLRTVLRSYGQSKHAKKVADAIVQARYLMIDIRTPADLINFVCGVLGGDQSDSDSEGQSHNSGDHQDEQAQLPPQRNFADSANLIPASAGRIFQALRILVNNELNELDCALRAVHYLLRPNAPFAVITYNALEHAIVKRHFTGRNVDASVDKIGRPQHRYAKMMGTETRTDDCRPWHPQDVMVTRWGQPIRHPQWKHSELRLARKNAAASYDKQTKVEAER